MSALDFSGANNLILHDVTAMSLGVETDGGIFEIIIPRNSPIPFEASMNFTNAEGNQKVIKFKVGMSRAAWKAEKHAVLGRIIGFLGSDLYCAVSIGQSMLAHS